MNPTSAGIVLLAAGEGRRYGDIKQLATIYGEPMVRRAARTALATGAAVTVVIGAHLEAVQLVLEDLPLQLIHHRHWQEGMGSSLAAGIRALLSLQPAATGALFCLSDQPTIGAAMLSRLLQRHQEAPDRILATDQGETIGPPALFPRDCFDTLLAWSGTRGAQALLQREAARVETFAFGPLVDVDTPADLLRVREQILHSPR
jgi:CTP:molybdopterin cytidylyltransferase MocA